MSELGLAITYSRACAGIQAPIVIVETDISVGLPKFSIVGLPETAVKESKDRVRSALLNSNLEFPSQRMTINLAPADLPKIGGRFDLPIAVGILSASDQLPKEKLADYEFVGELALTGELRSVHGALPFAMAMRHTKRKLIVPMENADEAALAGDVEVYPAKYLMDVCHHLLETKLIERHVLVNKTSSLQYYPDLKEVRGQEHAKRALEIAAAGQHSLLMIGPPGTGKTMMASRLSGILPDMTEDEALEVAAVNSISGRQFDIANWRKRRFRAPHHTASSVALVGGGSPPKPGEISLAHFGVLFLDELPEYQRNVLEALREPLESGYVTISRASHQAEFPAKFQLLSAMNPCPCGYLGDSSSRCSCTPDQVQRYRSRLSGPLLDRIDLHVEVPKLPKGLLSSQRHANAEKSEVVKQRVIQARDRQLQRAQKTNAMLTNSDIEMFCRLDEKTRDLLDDALEKMKLSARSYHRILRVARTISDLADCDNIQQMHVQEALSFRKLN